MSELIVGYLLKKEDFASLNSYYMKVYPELFEHFGNVPRLHRDYTWYANVNQRIKSKQLPFVLSKVEHHEQYGIFGYVIPTNTEEPSSSCVFFSFSSETMQHYLDSSQQLLDELHKYGCDIQGKPQIYNSQYNINY